MKGITYTDKNGDDWYRRVKDNDLDMEIRIIEKNGGIIIEIDNI